MAEIVFQYAGDPVPQNSPNIRWLTKDDLAIFNQHLTLCGQKIFDQNEWDELWADHTVYCMLFADGLPVARACVEKYTADCWEVADVRVVKEYRNRGFAFAVSRFVLNYILENGRTATIRTEEDNHAMLRVIRKLGFS